MRPMQDKDFDRLFKDRFEAFEVEPSDSVWQKITREVDKPVQKKKKTFTPYWMAAASVVLLTSAVLWLNKPEEVIKLQGKLQEQVMMKQTKVTALDTQDDKSQVIDEPASKVIMAAQPEKTKYLVSHKEVKSKITQANKTVLPEKTNPEAPANEEVFVAAQKVSIDVLNQQKPTTNQGDLVVMAKVDESEIEEPGEIEATSPRIKSVGGLVNFVIAQVDRRDDKIIEFRDGEEGSTVSGINIGPLKFKSRNK